MSYSSAKIQETLLKFQRHPKDTASSEAQVALITYRLQYLHEHFSKNPKDHHSKMGLLKLVGKRKKLLSYLKKKNFDAYKELISKLGIRK